ncbi:MAG TPA: hypothetical protein VHA34_14735, partial [Actinomycetes bacterium]|nr:hypothetical protein [Actinomycetes bacterium]
MRLLPEKVRTLPRHPGDALRLVAGLAILLGCTATVRPDHVGVLETDLFRLANDLPTALYPAFWVVMQAGNVLAVGVASVVVAATRRFWLAAADLVLDPAGGQPHPDAGDGQVGGQPEPAGGGHHHRRDPDGEHVAGLHHHPERRV